MIPVMVSILFLIWGMKDAQTQKSVRIKERETMGSGYREKKQKLHWTLQRIGEEQKEKHISLNNVKEQLEELDFSGEEEQRLKKDGTGTGDCIRDNGEGSGIHVKRFRYSTE